MVYVVWFNTFHMEDELVAIYADQDAAQRWVDSQGDGSQMRVEPYRLD